MIKKFCDKCGVELKSLNHVDCNQVIQFNLFKKGDLINDNKSFDDIFVELDVVGSYDWSDFSICVECVLKEIKKYIDSICFERGDQ